MQKVSTVQAETEQNKKLIQSAIKRPAQQAYTPEPYTTDVNTSVVQNVMNDLAVIRETIASFEQRIIVLERQYSIPLVETVVQPEEDTSDAGVNDETLTDEEYSLQEARKEYFNSLEESINIEIDEEFTQVVRESFEQMVTSRDDWAQGTSLKSAECSANSCMVVLSYSRDMDPMSQTEFDNMAFMWNKDLPRAKARYKSNPDGTTDIIMYYAKTGSRLPRMP